MKDIHPDIFRRLQKSVNPTDRDKLAQKVLSDLGVQGARSHRAEQVGFYVFLTLTSGAMLLAIVLSTAAGFELHKVNIEVVRWTWSGFFVGGGTTSVLGWRRK
jgi:hypothetical protein